MNTFLLLKVKAAILAEPEHYAQNIWDGESSCGTGACIAGWVARLNGFRLIVPSGLSGSERYENDYARFVSAQLAVQKLLKIDADQWNRLVFVDKWPRRFTSYNRDYVKGRTAKARAITAGKRIDKFIETEGRE